MRSVLVSAGLQKRDCLPSPQRRRLVSRSESAPSARTMTNAVLAVISQARLIRSGQAGRRGQLRCDHELSDRDGGEGTQLVYRAIDLQAQCKNAAQHKETERRT